MIKENQFALKVFHSAAKNVPAYRNVLKNHGIDPAKIKTLDDFKTLPVINKKNYIYEHSLTDVFPDKIIPPMAYASSGSSGKPTFWFRGDEQEEMGGELHEVIFSKIFKIKKNEPTLVVICFAMGVWVAGNYTMASCRHLFKKGYNITTITPGVEKGDIFNALKELAPRFKNLVLVGYPPFIMDVIHESFKKGIKFDNQNVKILTAGDKFSESWRDSVLKLINKKDEPDSLVSIYGSADAGFLGHETPLSIFLRRESLKNKKLYKSLFGDAGILPGFVHYHPSYVFFEEISGELVFTINTAVPLVRYNIHDTGKVISHEEIKEILKELNLEKEAQAHGLSDWNLPFTVIKGRSDVAVTFYALNIFPEHILAGIQNKKVSKFLSGTFSAYNKTVNKNRTQKLYIKLELAKGVKMSHDVFRLVSRSVVENLIKLNIEYRKLYQVIGTKALPTVSFTSFGDQSFISHEIKGVLNIKGKKPRFIS
ncbi:MAG: hypothetical protein AAB949_00105 [Patescibacteria group bacterium]